MSAKRLFKALRFAIYRIARQIKLYKISPVGVTSSTLETAGWSTTILAAMTLVRAKRFAEADQLIERALAVYPGDPSLLVEHALNAHLHDLRHEAIARWEVARTAAPHEALCYSNLAANLRAIGEYEAAGLIIVEALQRFPRNLRVLSEEARIAESDARFADALPLWARLARRFNPPADWLRGHVHALTLLGRFEEAKAVLDRALALHPNSQLLRAVEGILASSREDWTKAVELWAAYRRSFPSDSAGWEHYGRAVQGALLAATDENLAAKTSLTAPLKVDVVDDESVRQLLLGFESLGDSCEFGSVQRRYAAEPLGLLRWNDVQLHNLLAALARRFEGMGEPENTEMPIIDNGEYTVKDRRWDLWMHTFLFEGQTDPEALLPKMCRRVVYLRDKLVADLAAAEKIFVYCTDAIDAGQVAALHAALSAYGPVKLLAVQPVGAASDLTGAPGELVQLGERRWIGHLSRLGVAAGNDWDIAFEDWISICRKVAVQARVPSEASTH